MNRRTIGILATGATGGFALAVLLFTALGALP